MVSVQSQLGETQVTEHLTADDFFTGLFASLAIRHVGQLSLRRDVFDRASAGAFEEFQRLARERNVELGFRIRLHPTHGDSITVRDSLANAAQRDLVSFDNPEYQDIRLKIGVTEARAILSAMPGGLELFNGLADSFMDHYDAVA